MKIELDTAQKIITHVRNIEKKSRSRTDNFMKKLQPIIHPLHIDLQDRIKKVVQDYLDDLHYNLIEKEILSASEVNADRNNHSHTQGET
jgi:flagellin-specific chaperone FliS